MDSSARRRVIARDEPLGAPPWEVADVETGTTLTGHVKPSVVPVELQALALNHISLHSAQVVIFTYSLRWGEGGWVLFVVGTMS